MEQTEKKKERGVTDEKDLETLPTSTLLKHFEHATDKGAKDRVCRVLLQRDTSSWKTEDLLRFVEICPKEVNNGKAVDHAERSLFTRIDTMQKDHLLQFLKYVLHSRPQSERPSEVKRIVDVLLDKRLDSLEPKDMFALLPLVEPERAKDLLAILYNNRYQLSGVQLLQIARLLFTSPPSTEIQEVMNALYEREIEREKIESGKMFGFIRPSYHTPPPDPKTRHSEQPSRYFMYFQPHPSKRGVHYLDVTFNPINEQQIQNNGLQALSYGVVLTGHIAEDQAVEVYFSLPPFSAEKSVLIGYLGTDNPLLPLDYPLPIVGAVTAVRIVVRTVKKDQVKATPIKGEVTVHGGLGGSPYISPSKRFRGVTGASPVAESSEVTVCYGETHVFKLTSEDDFDELLKRACRRWNVSPGGYELQDENFKTLTPTTKVLEYMGQRGSIIRLAKKGFNFSPFPGGGGGQPVENVFAPGPFQVPGLPFGHKNLFEK